MLLTAALSVSLLSGCISVAQSTTVTQSVETSSVDTPSADGSSADKTSKSTAKPPADNASYTVGVGQFVEHDSLDNRREGFMAGPIEEGIKGGVNLAALYDNSQADGGTASQTATNFIGRGMDLMCGIATLIVRAEHGVAKKPDIPITFTAIADPVATELASADDTPAGEVTDISDKLPAEAQLKMICEILPEAKNINTIHTTNEVDSESVIAEYKELAPQYGFEAVDTDIFSSADIALAANTLMNKVDCITNLTGNIVAASLPTILNKAIARNIPVFGSEIEQAKIECLAAMGLDYIGLGRQTGRMAVQVLRGEKKISEMNHETIREAAPYGDIRAAGSLGITLPEDLTRDAAELFTEIAQ